MRNKNSNKQLTSGLQEAINHAGHLVQKDSVSNKLAASSKKVGDNLVFNNGLMIKTKKIDWLGQKKNFYDVYNTRTGKIEAKDLGLFITAMALVKSRTGHKSNNDMRRIIDMDLRYQQYLNDAAIFGIRLKSKKISNSKSDVYQVRMDESMLQCQRVKDEIRSCI